MKIRVMFDADVWFYLVFDRKPLVHDPSADPDFLPCRLQGALPTVNQDGQRRGFLRPAGPPGGGPPEGELPPEEGAGGQLQPPVQTGDGDVRHEGQRGLGPPGSSGFI